MIDCETTGREKHDHVVEIAAVDVDRHGAPLDCIKQTLVNPGCKIPPESSAHHHITDEMVQGAPNLKTALEEYIGADCYVAHNSRYDQTYLGTFDTPWIDTYRSALVAWPDAPSYSNQALSYYLKTKRPPVDAGFPHRALYDAWTTAFLFAELTRKLSIDELVEISSKPARLSRIGFGKHRGESFCDIPTDYLQWMQKQDFDEDIAYTVEVELKNRQNII